MAKKKEEGRLELICFDDNTFDVKVEGEKSLLTRAMATALLDRNEDNAFANVTHDAISQIFPLYFKESAVNFCCLFIFISIFLNH